MSRTFTKDADAILDYVFDWTAWLAADADTIASHTITVPTGITLVTSSNTTTAATAWLSGGTVGVEYDIGCEITTAGGRVDERTISVHVVER